MPRNIIVLSLLISLAACEQVEEITQEMTAKSPWEKYARSHRPSRQ